MKLLWRLSREAIRYKNLYVVAILSTLGLTAVNLAAPRVLSSMTGIVERGMDETSLRAIGVLTAILLALYLLRVAFRFLSNYLAHKAAWYLVGDLRTKIYDKLERLDLGFFHDKQTGDLMSRVVNDTRDFELLYAHIIPEMITNVVTFLGVLAILLTINWKLALITCFPIPLILVSGVIFAKKVRPFFRVSQRKMGELSGKLQDNLSGIHEIQSFGQESFETERVDEKNFDHVRAMLKALKISAVFHPSVEFLSSIGTILVVAFGGLLAYQGNLSVEDIVSFVLYLSLFYAPISGLATLLENMQQSMAGAERVMLVLDTPSRIQDRKGAKPLRDPKGAIEFDHVSFAYTEGEPILQDISFRCEPGMMVALVGPTGVGKTTLTQLISRFYEPTSGRILVDGQDIQDVTVESLRRNISPVLQDTFLFNGTIEENSEEVAEFSRELDRTGIRYKFSELAAAGSAKVQTCLEFMSRDIKAVQAACTRAAQNISARGRAFADKVKCVPFVLSAAAQGISDAVRDAAELMGKGHEEIKAAAAKDPRSVAAAAKHCADATANVPTRHLPKASHGAHMG